MSVDKITRTLKQESQRCGKQLQLKIDNLNNLGSARVVLVACMRNEMLRMPHFLEYYRKLGVEHFFIIDNNSEDGLLDFLDGHPDVSAWWTDSSYKGANFGMHWCNYVMNKYLIGKWVITCDPDEYLVYPYIEHRPLNDLITYMIENEQDALFTVMIDAYGPNGLSKTTLETGMDPFEACPYFDRFNFIQSYNPELKNFWVQGGPRMRRLFYDNPVTAPALNKVPLIRLAAPTYYQSSMHNLSDPRLNCTVKEDPSAVSGVLFHFKYVSLLTHKAKEEMSRGEHYGGSAEYKRYNDAGDLRLYHRDVSIRYEGSAQLRRLGFMQAGEWF